MQNPSNEKSFWSRKEGKGGMVIVTALAVGALILLYRFLPALIFIVENTLYLGALIGVGCFGAWIVFDPRNRAIIFYSFKIISKKMTGIIIQMDPIAILNAFVDSMEKNLGQMNEQITKLKSTMRRVKSRIDDNKNRIENNLTMAHHAQKSGNKKIIYLKTRKAGRLKDSTLTLEGLYTKMEVIYRVLTKMYDNCSILAEDTKEEIKDKQDEWEAVKQANSAMKSAMSVINGDKDKRAIYEQALSFMADDLENKIGEMERFMELSEDFTANVDLENEVMSGKGLEMLEKWEKDADSIILGNDKNQILSQAQDQGNVLNVDKPISVNRNNKNQFEELFSKS